MTLFRDAIIQIKKLHDHGVLYDQMEVTVNKETKSALENELRTRPSFEHAKGRELHISKLFEIDEKGKAVLNGWNIPIVVSEGVPVGQIWVGVTEYEAIPEGFGRREGLSGVVAGREVRKGLRRFPGRN
jgi:hypothetical protein